MPDRFTALFGITDPNAKDTDGDGWPDEVRLNPREDRTYDARRVNDFDSFGEEFSGDKDDYGQTRKFSLDGDPYAWTLSNHNDPDTLANLITFTAQGDLPLGGPFGLRWRPSTRRGCATLTLADLTAWENGTGIARAALPGHERAGDRRRRPLLRPRRPDQHQHDDRDREDDGADRRRPDRGQEGREEGLEEGVVHEEGQGEEERQGEEEGHAEVPPDK